MITMFLTDTRIPGRATTVFCATMLMFPGAMTSFAQAPMAPMGKRSI